jgi:MinD-like ATPase involved in chromosome partitioning or flagellar assembly
LQTSEGSSKTISVWGPAGSPGKSTIAINLACELSLSGASVFLLDLDLVAPSLAQMLGLNEHPAGLAAACRLAAQNRFDIMQLERLSVRVAAGKQSVSLMTGITSSSRWPEVTNDSLVTILELASAHFDYVVLDLASSLEPGLRQAHGAIERNQASCLALSLSEIVLAVCAADPVSIERFLADEPMVRQSAAGEVFILVNRLRKSVLGASAKTQISETLARLANLSVHSFVPDDPAATDQALLEAMPLALARRSSGAKQAIALFTQNHILGQRSRLDKRVAKLG